MVCYNFFALSTIPFENWVRFFLLFFFRICYRIWRKTIMYPNSEWYFRTKRLPYRAKIWYQIVPFCWLGNTRRKMTQQPLHLLTKAKTAKIRDFEGFVKDVSSSLSPGKSYVTPSSSPPSPLANPRSVPWDQPIPQAVTQTSGACLERKVLSISDCVKSFVLCVLLKLVLGRSDFVNVWGKFTSF